MQDVFVVKVSAGAEEENINNIKALCEECGVASVALMVTAVPNHEPLAERLREWRKSFRMLKNALDSHGVEAGILVQALIGHGDRGHLKGEPPFQTIVGADGTVCRESFCPLDKDFQNYARELIEELAAENPAFFMIDDDFRLHWHSPAHKGCMCDLHMRGFSEICGEEISREKLLDLLDGSAWREWNDKWEKFRKDTLVEMATVIRNAIDSVDENIKASFCNGAETHFAADIENALAGAHQPVIRVNNATYLEGSPKQFPVSIAKTMYQIPAFAKNTVVLTEADTCPHNRYSLSATTHLAQVACTVLLGCHGAKYWFTKTDDDEWDESKAYRQMLKNARPFFAELENVRDAVEWCGPRVVARVEEIYKKPWEMRGSWNAPSIAWGDRIMARFGMPFIVDGNCDISNPAPRLMSGTAPYGFSDEELKQILSGAVLLDGEAAWHIQERGLGEFLGAKLMENDMACTAEVIDAGALPGFYQDTVCSMTGGGRYTLDPIDGTCILSAYVSGTRGNFVPLSAASTFYENSLGGRVAVYGISLSAVPLDWIIFNGKRKRQLLGMLALISGGNPPVYLDTDLDVFTLYGRDTGRQDTEYMLLVNLSQDELSWPRLHMTDKDIASVQLLMPDGEWSEQRHCLDKEFVDLDFCAGTLRPCLLKLLKN